MSRTISKVAISITHMRELITTLFTTHEPPSRASRRRPGFICALRGAVDLWG